MKEAEKRWCSLNGYFVTVAHGFHGWFGRPDMVIDDLTGGHEALGLDHRLRKRPGKK